MKIWNGIDKDVCVGGEWHTFPSSYYLDGKIKFYEDGFMGLLPGTFGGNEKMNDRNQREMDRFISIDQCEYLVIMRFNKDSIRNELKNWKIVKFEKILDPDTKQPFRSFYFPWNSNIYGTYSLLQNPDYKQKP